MQGVNSAALRPYSVVGDKKVRPRVAIFSAAEPLVVGVL